MQQVWGQTTEQFVPKCVETSERDWRMDKRVK